MNLDKTFCTGVRCKDKQSCNRWIDNLINEAKEKGYDLINKPISIAEFQGHKEHCNMFEIKE